MADNDKVAASSNSEVSQKQDIKNTLSLSSGQLVGVLEQLSKFAEKARQCSPDI